MLYIVNNRLTLALLCGFLSIFILNAVITVVSIFLATYLLSQSEFALKGKEAYQIFISTPPYVYLIWAVILLKYINLISGGFIVGRMMRRKGLLWGGVLGIVTELILYFLSNWLTSNINYANISFSINNLLKPIATTILLTGLGGFLGERLSKSKSSKK